MKQYLVKVGFHTDLDWEVEIVNAESHKAACKKVWDNHKDYIESDMPKGGFKNFYANEGIDSICLTDMKTSGIVYTVRTYRG